MQNAHPFHDAMLIELKFEGGKDDDPIDPGGRTNQGVIQREFSAWLRKNGKPNRDVFTMLPDERDTIYDENYGNRICYDLLPDGVNVVVLDGAINSGPTQSVKWVQRCLGISADGVMGNATIQGIIDHPDHDILIAQILDRREAFLRSLKTFPHFGAGWMARVGQLKKIGQAWASGSVGPSPIFISNGNKKATIVDAKPLISTAPADATAAGGTVTTALTSVQSILQPLQGHSSTIDQIILGLLILGALATAFGFTYAYYARHKNTKLQDALNLNLAPIIGANDNAMLPDEVKREYLDPKARGSETGNIAPGVVTTSGRQVGDQEERVHVPAPVPADKVA